ncbi:MAG TPA: V-type ATPase subunit [Clostridia bacterium]|nr:V-type ATPase subunit [Clostridia bacterium]
MHDSEYAYGVARVRVNENSLLSAADTEQLISAPTYKDALRILADNGWKAPEDNEADFAEMLENEALKTWQLLTESVPDIRELDALVISNDFHNLKAALKAMFSDEESSVFFIGPSAIPTEIIAEAVETKRFEMLPEYMQAAAEAAYDAVVRLKSGRIADILLDVSALNTKLQMSKDSGSPLLLEITQLNNAMTNIKTAVRCAKMGKDAEFTKRAMCESEILDNDTLIEAALSGKVKLVQYLLTSFVEGAAEQLEIGAVEFEKWCDDVIGEKVQSAKFTAFGLDPIVAYYINKDTEIRNARIILSAKLNNIPPDSIRKRVRNVYV